MKNWLQITAKNRAEESSLTNWTTLLNPTSTSKLLQTIIKPAPIQMFNDQKDWTEINYNF